MRRLSIVVSFVVVFAAMLAAGALPGAIAQEGTPAGSAEHPLVGAWILSTSNPTSPRSPAVFSADGTYVQAEADGSDAVGVWEATGERSGTLTAVSVVAPGPDAPTVMIRATLEVAEDGQTMTGEYTLEFIAPDGTGSGQLGTDTVTGERITVEAPGEPVGPIGPPPGSPPATPGS